MDAHCLLNRDFSSALIIVSQICSPGGNTDVGRVGLGRAGSLTDLCVHREGWESERFPPCHRYKLLLPWKCVTWPELSERIFGV